MAFISYLVCWVKEIWAIRKSPYVSVYLALFHCRYLSCALFRVVSLPKSVAILFTPYYIVSKVFSLQATVVQHNIIKNKTIPTILLVGYKTNYSMFSHPRPLEIRMIRFPPIYPNLIYFIHLKYSTSLAIRFLHRGHPNRVNILENCLKRKERDSNPRYLSVRRFSRPMQSTTLPSFLCC